MTIFYYNPDNMSILEFQYGNRQRIHELTIKAIKECLDLNLDELPFLEIKPDNDIYVIRRHSFKKTLDKAKSYFESIEHYEKCQECIELINLIG